MIAMAMSCRPQLLLADEPTTALDVTIQAQILDLIQKLKEETNTSVVLITHNMGIVAEMARNVIVMYAGRIMEHATVDEIFENPCHPYTESLLKSIPRLDQTKERRPLDVIPGIVPSLLDLPGGCKFSDRCFRVLPKCSREEPPFFEIAKGRSSRCWLHE